MTDDPKITDRLFAAICRQKFKLAKILIEGGTNVNTTLSAGVTPLMSACDMDVDKSEEDEKYKLVLLLLDKNANVNSVDKYGRTPLHYACINGCQKVVDLLVRNGADASARDLNGNVPSFYIYDETDLETSSLPGKISIASMMNLTSIYHLWDSRDFLSVILE